MIQVWQFVADKLPWALVAYLAGVGTRDQIVRAVNRLAWRRLQHRR